MRVLITGAGGFIGQQLVADLAIQHPDWQIIAADIQPFAAHWLKPNIETLVLDLSQSAAVQQVVANCLPDAIVLLAPTSTTTGMCEAQVQALEVGGTRSLVQAAQVNGVGQLIVISSAAAYGYYPENAEWIDEDQPLRGHPNFVYAKHKREVEHLLATAREQHPQLKQLILRPGTILGKRAHNQINLLCKKRSVLGIRGSRSRFVFIWDQDVVSIIRQGLEQASSGIYNLAGDGALSLAEIATILGKPYRSLPAPLLSLALRCLKPLGLSEYGPEQLDFLRYRPVLANRRLKEQFGYQPRYSSREAFLAFLTAQGMPVYA
ncbi:MAG: NAD-dependent epimerase/dehydratase family protein [Pseudomonadaceae bacterium]|jgi:UDP-glucose 4-epimerase|nr:NAD-dependent epimerase/dehydratase family protein [Pseudomonadaceae bacterium]